MDNRAGLVINQHRPHVKHIYRTLIQQRFLVEFSCELSTLYLPKRFACCVIIGLCNQWLLQQLGHILGFISFFNPYLLHIVSFSYSISQYLIQQLRLPYISLTFYLLLFPRTSLFFLIVNRYISCNLSQVIIVTTTKLYSNSIT